MKNVFLWMAYFIPALAVEVLCYLSNWFVALFVTYEPRTDLVKRQGKRTITMQREYLIPLFRLWQTHDNAADEWWYGVYNTDHYFKAPQNWTQSDYNNSWWIRYYCRVCWLYRNNAYGWLYKLFSRPKEDATGLIEHGTEDSGRLWYRLELYPSSFKLEAQIPVGDRFASANMGWKAHKEVPRLLYANRLPLFSFKKYRTGK